MGIKDLLTGNTNTYIEVIMTSNKMSTLQLHFRIANNVISVKMGKIKTPPHFGGKLHHQKLFIPKIRSIAFVENF